jgi:hypothetical protein
MGFLEVPMSTAAILALRCSIVCNGLTVVVVVARLSIVLVIVITEGLYELEEE